MQNTRSGNKQPENYTKDGVGHELGAGKQIWEEAKKYRSIDRSIDRSDQARWRGIRTKFTGLTVYFMDVSKRSFSGCRHHNPNETMIRALPVSRPLRDALRASSNANRRIQTPDIQSRRLGSAQVRPAFAAPKPFTNYADPVSPVLIAENGHQSRWPGCDCRAHLRRSSFPQGAARLR